MNMPVPALLVICGMLIVIVLVLFWHPQRSRANRSSKVGQAWAASHSRMLARASGSRRVAGPL
jgi:hypothetical protein